MNFNCPKCAATYSREIKDSDKISFVCDSCHYMFEVKSNGTTTFAVDIPNAKYTSEELKIRSSTSAVRHNQVN